MRILYLSPREAWPPNSGAKLRDYHLACGLAQTAEVDYILFGSAEAAQALQRSFGSATAVTPPRKYTAGKILRGISGSTPLPILNYTSQEMRAAISAALTGPAYDVVHLDSIHMSGYLPPLRASLPKAVVTLDWHNIESEAMERFADSSPSALRRSYARYTAAGLKRAENELLARLHGHIVCSERERDLLLARNPAAKVAVVENGVDCSRFRPTDAVGTQRLVFVGQMSYGPNAEGAVWFVREVWPELRIRFPELTLDIVGADPSPLVKALGERPGVRVTGTVPDVRSYYEGALAAVVPLLSGAGTRLKILEAMAAGTPVISTALGAEGLAVVDGTHFLLADRPASWMQAVEALSQPERAAALATAGRALVVHRYDWSILGRKLADLYQEWTSAAAAN